MNDIKQIVEFKSEMSNFIKEQSGTKPNTVRKVDENDKRFKLLKMWAENLNFDLRIIIKLCNCNDDNEIWEAFERQIKDVTLFDGYCIISWRD